MPCCSDYYELSWTKLGKSKILSFVDPSLWTFVIFCPTRAKTPQSMRNSYSNKYLLDLPLLLMVFFYGRYLEFLAEELSQKCGTGYTKLIVVSAKNPTHHLTWFKSSKMISENKLGRYLKNRTYVRIPFPELNSHLKYFGRGPMTDSLQPDYSITKLTGRRRPWLPSG